MLISTESDERHWRDSTISTDDSSLNKRISFETMQGMNQLHWIIKGASFSLKLCLLLDQLVAALCTAPRVKIVTRISTLTAD